jgi:hypothetical protein
MNVAVTTAAEGFPRRAFMVDDIARVIDAGILGEDERFELVEGETVMTASKGGAHKRIKSALLVAVARALPDDQTMASRSRCGSPTKTMLEPPGSTPGEARDRVAVSSLAYDEVPEAKLYGRHRFREFWANEGVTYVHAGPDGDGWSLIVTYGPEDALATPALSGFSVKRDGID